MRTPKQSPYFPLLVSLTLLVFFVVSHAAVIEDTQVRLEGAADTAVIQFGGETLVAAADFYLASAAWGSMFPRNAATSTVEKSPGLLNIGVKDNASNRAHFSFKPRPLGAHIELTATVPPGYGAKYAVWDLFLSKAYAMGGTLRLPGKPDITFNPKDFPGAEIEQFSIITSDGEFVFSLKGDRGVPWKIRSVCDRAWGPEAKRSFDLLWQMDAVPAEGVTFNLVVDVALKPSPTFLAGVARRVDLVPREFFSNLQVRYGGGNVASGTLNELASRVASLSGDLTEDRRSPLKPQIVPLPKEVTWGRGVFALPPVVTVDGELPGPRSLLTEKLAALGIPLGAKNRNGAAHFTLALAADPLLAKSGLPLKYLEGKKEAYLLSVMPTGVFVAGSDLAGLVHGVQSLLQIMTRRPTGVEIPTVQVKDQPDIAFRGFYLEGAGPLSGTDDYRQLLRDTYSRFHANTVMAELRWSQVKWKSHPEISGPKARTLEDLAKSARETRELGMEWIPALFSYGKVNDLLKTHPEIAEHSNWAKTGAAWCPNKQETYALVFDLLKELIEATGCTQIHIGHDEIQGMALCPTCKAANPADLFADDVNRIADFLATRGVGTMIWGDFLLDYRHWTPKGVVSCNSSNPYFDNLAVHPGLSKIRKSVVICDWHYDEAKDYPTFKYFADAGHPVIGCPWYLPKNNVAIAQSIGAIKARGVLVTDWGFAGPRAPGAVSILGVTHAWNLSQPNPENLAWDPMALLSASLLPANRPSQGLGAKAVAIPLESSANRPLTGEGDTWFGAGAQHDLSFLPQGDVRFFGMSYRIGPKAVVVGPLDGGTPRVSVPVGKKVKSLVMLGGLQTEEVTLGSRVYGRYRITYQSGKVAEALISHRNAAHWYSTAPRKNPWGIFNYAHTWDSLLAWEGMTRQGEVVNLQAFEWVNPQPDDAVASLEISVDGAAKGVTIGLVALTAVVGE